MIIDVSATGNYDESRLKEWNKDAAQAGDPVTAPGEVTWGAIHGYIEAVADILGESQANKLLHAIRGNTHRVFSR